MPYYKIIKSSELSKNIEKLAIICNTYYQNYNKALVNLFKMDFQQKFKQCTSSDFVEIDQEAYEGNKKYSDVFIKTQNNTIEEISIGSKTFLTNINIEIPNLNSIKNNTNHDADEALYIDNGEPVLSTDVEDAPNTIYGIIEASYVGDGHPVLRNKDDTSISSDANFGKTFGFRL